MDPRTTSKSLYFLNVPNCGLEFTDESKRRGTEVIIPFLKKCSKREQSFQVYGGKLFNSIPKYLRQMAGNNLDDFKERQDIYLSSIPDEPKVDGYIPGACDDLTAKPSNSVIDQSKQNLNTRVLRGWSTHPLSVSINYYPPSN